MHPVFGDIVKKAHFPFDCRGVHFLLMPWAAGCQWRGLACEGALLSLTAQQKLPCRLAERRHQQNADNQMNRPYRIRRFDADRKHHGCGAVGGRRRRREQLSQCRKECRDPDSEHTGVNERMRSPINCGVVAALATKTPINPAIQPISCPSEML